MLHIALHFLVPPIVAWVFYRARWRQATLILVATMLVDLDHLLADPIYDPERCSIGFHPLHSWPAIVLYAGLFLMPLFLAVRRRIPKRRIVLKSHARRLHLMGAGLLIHMALDAIDCVI